MNAKILEFIWESASMAHQMHWLLTFSYDFTGDFKCAIKLAFIETLGYCWLTSDVLPWFQVRQKTWSMLYGDIEDSVIVIYTLYLYVYDHLYFVYMIAQRWWEWRRKVHLLTIFIDNWWRWICTDITLTSGSEIAPPSHFGILTSFEFLPDLPLIFGSSLWTSCCQKMEPIYES